MVDQEFNDLCNLCNNDKEQFTQFLNNFIVKVADLETSITKINLAKELLRAQIKFCKSLICSKLARPNLTLEITSEINNRSLRCAHHIVDDHAIKDSDLIRLEGYLEMNHEKHIIACKRKILNEAINENETDAEKMHHNVSKKLAKLVKMKRIRNCLRERQILMIISFISQPTHLLNSSNSIMQDIQMIGEKINLNAIKLFQRYCESLQGSGETFSRNLPPNHHAILERKT